MSSIHDETEISLSSGAVVVKELTDILNTVIGVCFADVSYLLNAICDKCKDSAITCYNFILCAKENSNILHKAIEHLEICFKGTPESILKKCKTMYVEIDVSAESDSVIKRYYDRKHNDNQSKALNRIIHITQHQKNMKNLFSFEGNDYPVIDMESDPLTVAGDELKVEPQISLVQSEMPEEQISTGTSFEVSDAVDRKTYSEEPFQKPQTERKLKSTKKEFYQCNHCRYNTFHKYRLIYHIQFAHSDSHLYCDLCGKKCTTSETLQAHKLTHSSDEYECHICKQKLKTALLLKCHMSLHNKDGRLGYKLMYCPDCNAGFNSVELFQKHRTRKRKCTTWHRGYFPCNQCNYVAPYNSHLVDHIRFKHEHTKGVVCEVCGKHVASETLLKKHQLVHTDERKYYKCSECGRMLKSALSLKNHTKMHTGEKDFPCHICGKRFAIYANCRAHLKRVHFKTDEDKSQYDEQKLALARLEILSQQPSVIASFSQGGISLPNLGSNSIKDEQDKKVLNEKVQSSRGFKFFNCPDCKAGFNSPELYEKHRAAKRPCTDRKRGSYPCDQCNHISAYRHQLRYHIQVKHENTGVFCEVCGKCFVTNNRLKLHQTTHITKKFECKECGKYFKSTFALEKHTTLHTGEFNYPCHICGERFRCPSARLAHVKRNHMQKDSL